MLFNPLLVTIILEKLGQDYATRLTNSFRTLIRFAFGTKMYPECGLWNVPLCKQW